MKRRVRTRRTIQTSRHRGNAAHTIRTVCISAPIELLEAREVELTTDEEQKKLEDDLMKSRKRVQGGAKPGTAGTKLK
jgi:hypothetical protein